MSDGVFITGTSSGLGRGLAEEYLARGRDVYGLSRRRADISSDQFHAVQADLADMGRIGTALDELVGGADISLVILCAGVLGDFKSMPDIPVEDLRQAMEINVWANKVILDWFAAHGVPRQIVLVSSGASVKGHRGWGGYALSKAALNMLAQLYAHDLPESHLVALAPGLVQTAMQDRIYDEADADAFPSVAGLKQARGTADMPDPRTVAHAIADALPTLPGRYPSGEFVDIRQIA